MPIEFRCRRCNRLLRTPDETAGKQAKCPECGGVMDIPLPSPELATGPFGPRAEPYAPPERAGGSPFSADVPLREKAGGGENPYQSPADYQAMPSGMAHVAAPDLHAYALSRVSGPATALIVTGGLGLALQLVAVAAQIVALAMGGAVGVNQNPPAFIASGGMSIVFGLFGIAMGVLVVVGAIKMKRLENYGLSMSSAIVAMVPCLSPCCLLGLPFGIWALVVLSDGRVQAAFSAAKSAP